MKVKKMKKIVVLFMLIVMAIVNLSPVATAITGEKGSITLNIKDSTGAPLSNVDFRLYFIAEATENGNDLKYEFVSPYNKANINISDLQDAYLPVHLAYFSSSHSLNCIEKSTDENGSVVFDNLNSGLYLVVLSQSDSRYLISPFIISVPEYDIKNHLWRYDVNASPKITDGEADDEDYDTYISVVKKWEASDEIPENITVVLLRDFQEYEVIQLNEENNWHYRWDNLSKNNVWNVVEMHVPDGYTVSYETSSNSVTIINKCDKIDETTTRPVDGDESESTTKAPEKDEDDLIHTGQLNWPVPVLAVIGLVLFSIGWSIVNLGKKESE